MERVLTTKKGMSVRTSLSDAEALAGLHVAAATSGFARDLCQKARQWGLSPDQMAWAHKLALDSAGRNVVAIVAKSAPADNQGIDLGIFGVEFVPGSESAPEPAPVVDVAPPRYAGIVALLGRAHKAGLKYPKLRLQTEHGVKVVLSLAGAGSKYRGAIHVSDGSPYGTGGAYWGRIDVDGTWAPRAATPEVEGLLDRLQADPSGLARVQGQLTDHCCFCGLELSTRESVVAGYGPQCARRFGLDWGSIEGYSERKARALEVFETQGEAE